MPRYSKAAQESLRKKIEASKNCSHPKDKQVQLGLGIYCDLCKIRVAMVSDADAEKLITNAIVNMF